MEVGILIKDQYQVVEHVGRGGMADVWSARDQRLNRLVAIKTIAQSLSTDADPIALFEQEAQTIAQMEHPHILPIYDFGDYRNSLYIVMRYVTGGSLEDKLEDKPLTLQETLQIGSNIAKALDYAHENNVIHLDLKPPNILMDSSGSPYLADFGLATVLDKQGRARNPGSGTLLYMAPEQLVAEVIDHRADIYSFCIMIWHMLTGTLPFDGMIPIAMKQLQFQEELPSLDQFNEEIPYQITDILRQGTSVEANNRQGSLTEIIEQMREAVKASTIDLDDAWGGIDSSAFDQLFGVDEALNLGIEDAVVMEAADIYIRAKHTWSGGNGRFLLGVSHFMMMCDYYMEAEEHGLELDDAGKQMILRGALEYDYQVDYWWNQLTEVDQRWVCLHTIRSENAPARIRALYRLETLSDDPQTPVIPKLVANALAIETIPEAKLAALAVLGTRAKLIKPSQSYNIKTEYRGQLLNTTTRLGIEILPPEVWQEAVYSPEIDLLIAEEALKEDSDDAVTERAARIIGLMHSLTALRAIADAQRQNQPNALRALALIRDEAPYLPDVVSRQARAYAWVANTIRRITDVPMQLVLRFIFALLGGAIGFGQHVYITYRSQALFVPQRWGNTLAVGLLMGLFIAILVMFSDALISRLKGFWPNWLRLITSVGFGILFGTLTWTGFTWLYLNQPPVWDLMRMGGIGLAFGLIASTIFSLKSWQSFIISTIIIFLTIFAAYYNNCTQLYICFADSSFNLVEGVTNFSISPVAVVGGLFGLLLGLFIPKPQPIVDGPPAQLYDITKFGGLLILLSIVLGVSLFSYNAILSQASVTWDHIILLFGIPTIIAAIAMVLLDTQQRILYAVFSVLGLGFLMTYVQNSLTTIDTLVSPQFGADYIDALFSYDLYWQSFTVVFPVALVISFGAFGMGMFRDLRRLIGEPYEEKERNAWLTGILLYVMTLSAIMTVFAPFSLHKDILWSIGWTAIGVGTFIVTLATWQWKRWGANSLIAFALLFVAGAFLADYRHVITDANEGVYSQLFTIQSFVTWGLWAIATAIMTLGIMRRKLWGAFGLIAMIGIWFIISLFLNDIGDSLTTLAILHVPLIAYAVRFDWHLFENGERKEKAKKDAPIPAPITTPVDSTDMGKIVAPVAIPASELGTSVEIGNPIINARNLETELDPMSAGVSPFIDDEDDIDTTEFQTELSPTLPDPDQRLLETEFDINNPDTDIESVLDDIDTGVMESQADPDESDKPASGTRKGLKIDTGLLSSKTTPAQPPKPDAQTRKGLKIDTGLLSSKTTPADTDKPASGTRKGLKIDTGLLSSKTTPAQPPKPDAQTRKGLKIDTGLLGKDSPNIEPSDKPDDDEIDPSTKDETVSSRKTTKLSTAQIKKEIAEEAIRMKEAADRQKAENKESKPKFKLNTSLVKKDDKTSEDEE